MCIICFKPSGAAMPSREVLETCFLYNPDGAGYALHRAGEKSIYYKKGFFDFEELMGALEKEGINPGDDLAVHFRIATNGEVVAKNCHPFYLSTDKKLAFSEEGTCKSVLFHNGILSKKYAYDKNVSDTYLFTLALAKKEKELKAKKGQALENFIKAETAGSRILYFCADKMVKSGEWIHDEKTGCFFSNQSFAYVDFAPYYPRPYHAQKPYIWAGSDTKKGKSVYFGEWEEDLPPMCPVCGNVRFSQCISSHHDIWECGNCHSLFDSMSNELEFYETYPRKF